MFWQAVLLACNWIALVVWGCTLVVIVAAGLSGQIAVNGAAARIVPHLTIVALIAFLGLLNGVI